MFVLIDPLVSAASVLVAGSGIWAARPRFGTQRFWFILGLATLALAWYLPAQTVEGVRYGVAAICDVRRASTGNTSPIQNLPPELRDGVVAAEHANAPLDRLCGWE